MFEVSSFTAFFPDAFVGRQISYPANHIACSCSDPSSIVVGRSVHPVHQVPRSLNRKTAPPSMAVSYIMDTPKTGGATVQLLHS